MCVFHKYVRVGSLPFAYSPHRISDRLHRNHALKYNPFLSLSRFFAWMRETQPWKNYGERLLLDPYEAVAKYHHSVHLTLIQVYYTVSIFTWKCLRDPCSKSSTRLNKRKRKYRYTRIALQVRRNQYTFYLICSINFDKFVSSSRVFIIDTNTCIYYSSIRNRSISRLWISELYFQIIEKISLRYI